MMKDIEDRSADASLAIEPLKPCPFCGEHLVLKGDYNDESGWNYYAHADEDGECVMRSHRVGTNVFDMNTPGKEDSRRWNTRAALSQAPQGRSSNHSTKSGEEK
jgi:hypothetical protein